MNRKAGFAATQACTSMGILAASAATLLAAGAAIAGDDLCERTAELVLRADLNEARADFWLNIANASTYADSDERREQYDEARDTYEEEVELAEAQAEAREDLCELLGEHRYDPQIDPDNFLTPSQIEQNPNPYWPMIRGTTYWYESKTDEGLEVIRVKITYRTREILGVRCVEVRDTVWLDGDKIEDTRDWYAQDVDGNVWYFGEIALNYEDGFITDVAGSWVAGEDGGKPGIIMLADPQVGNAYRQEMLLGEAEDAGEVLAVDASVKVPYGSFDHCVETRDFTPIDPEANERKFYAPGVGFVLEVKPDTGETLELIDIEHP